jgi:hypothetical protein
MLIGITLFSVCFALIRTASAVSRHSPLWGLLVLASVLLLAGTWGLCVGYLFNRRRGAVLGALCGMVLGLLGLMTLS